jgi:hypothetical protein
MEVSEQIHASVTFPLGTVSMVPKGQGAGLAPELVWTLWRKVISLNPVGNRTLLIQL